MKIPLLRVLKDTARLGSGEFVSRLANVVTVMLLGHRYGVVLLGVYALGQSVTQYLQPLIDFGARHVGARLVASHPQFAREIIRRVQCRRLVMAGAILPLFLAYAAYVRLPAEMKLFLVAFSATSALYVGSLDWAAWGREDLNVVGFAKAAVPVCILCFVIVGRPSSDLVLWRTVAGNVCGFLLQATIFWIWWIRCLPSPASGVIPVAIEEGLRWKRTSLMGMALLCNLAFNSIDVLMLGMLSGPREVGLYSASYRVLNQVLATYYLLTQVLYPRFARQPAGERLAVIAPRILLPLIASGMAIAFMISLLRRPVLSIMFGHEFLAAGPLLLLLVWSIPLDFVTSYLSTAFIAWGMEKKILASTAVAAGSNIVLNLAFIPSFGARAAAANTLVSYVIFLAALSLAGRGVKELEGPKLRLGSAGPRSAGSGPVSLPCPEL